MMGRITFVTTLRVTMTMMTMLMLMCGMMNDEWWRWGSQRRKWRRVSVGGFGLQSVSLLGVAGVNWVLVSGSLGETNHFKPLLAAASGSQSVCFSYFFIIVSILSSSSLAMCLSGSQRFRDSEREYQGWSFVLFCRLHRHRHVELQLQLLFIVDDDLQASMRMRDMEKFGGHNHPSRHSKVSLEDYQDYQDYHIITLLIISRISRLSKTNGWWRVV
jgi:hypothetical protein